MCKGDEQGLPGKCARVVGEMCKGCREDVLGLWGDVHVQGLMGRCARVAGDMC